MRATIFGGGKVTIFWAPLWGGGIFKKIPLRGGLRFFEIVSIHHESLSSEFSLLVAA